MYLKGEKIELREFTFENLKDQNYFRWLRDKDVVKSIGRIEYLTNLNFDNVEKYINELINSDNNCLFAIYTKKGNFIGTIKIGHINWRTNVGDVGIMIGDKKYWGRGIAKDAINLIINYSFEYLSLRKLTSGCASSNEAMVKVFEKTGFSIEATLKKNLLISGKYDDHILFGLLKDEYK